MYCETQPRYPGKAWMDLFPDSAFPNETAEDKARSESLYTQAQLPRECDGTGNTSKKYKC